MKVAVLTYDFPSAENPASGRFVLRHVAALARSHDVRVVQARVRLGLRRATSTRSRTVDGVTVEEVVVQGLPGAAHVRAARLVSTRVAEAELLHTMALESLFLGSLVRRRGPWVHTEHSTEWTDPVAAGPVRVWTALSRSRIRRPDAVTAVSSYLGAAVERRRRRHDVHVVPNVVTVPAPEPQAPVPTGEAAAPAAPVTLVSAGALVEMKRPLLAADTVAELVRRGVIVRWTWIGAGPLEPALRARAAQQGIADLLEVVPFLEPAAYLDLLRQADVFLLPSAYETFCVVAAEAIGCGVPVVLSDRGGQQDFVGAASGRLVAGGDPAAFADALQDVLASTDRAALLAAAADLRTRFAAPAIAHEFDAVYAAVVRTETSSGAPT